MNKKLYRTFTNKLEKNTKIQESGIQVSKRQGSLDLILHVGILFALKLQLYWHELEEKEVH